MESEVQSGSSGGGVSPGPPRLQQKELVVQLKEENALDPTSENGRRHSLLRDSVGENSNSLVEKELFTITEGSPHGDIDDNEKGAGPEADHLPQKKQNIERILEEFFGYSSFRPFQKEVVTQILKGKDCLVIMATGSGKSICYQLPPLITKKTAIVISPLVSLMQDQVMGLQQRGIRAEYMGSAQTDRFVNVRAQNGEYDVLYMTPEKACSVSQSFWTTLLKRGVSLLAVDEAHCVSKWSHNFRYEYEKLDSLRPSLPKVPFVALTSIATTKVREDIVLSLNLGDAFTAIASFDRPNIFYGVKGLNHTAAFKEELAREILKNSGKKGTTIVYCTTVKDVEEVVEALQKAGADASPYHAKMSSKLRTEVHRAFSTDELQIVVATVAFGMGIDKPDIRLVVHYGCPRSLEAYYQESGRCGRDGLPSQCWLYNTKGDFAKGDFHTSGSTTAARKEAVMQAYMAAQKYCGTVECRRSTLLKYFGESTATENCGNCDNCVRPGGIQYRNFSEEAHLLMTAIKACGGKFGLGVPIDVLRGSMAKKVVGYGFEKSPVHGLGRGKSANWWKSLADQPLGLGYLREVVRDTFRLISVADKGDQFLWSATNMGVASALMLPISQEMAQEESKQSEAFPQPSPKDSSMDTHLQLEGFSETERGLYHLLMKTRADIARRNSIAPYAILDEKALQRIAKLRPSSEARLRNIDGVNKWLVSWHGKEILDAINKHTEDLTISLENDEISSHPSSVSRFKMEKSIRGDIAKIQIFVTSFSGKTFSLHVKEDETVVGVQRMIEDVEGISREHQRIIFQGRQLSEGSTVSDYNIQRESTLHLVSRLYGSGGNHDSLAVLDRLNRKAKRKLWGSDEAKDSGSERKSTNVYAPLFERPSRNKTHPSVEAAAANIVLSELKNFLSDMDTSAPDVQLPRCADYFGRALSAVSTAQFGWNKILRETPLVETIEIPLCLVPEALKKMLGDWLAQRPKKKLSKFVLWLLKEVLIDAHVHTGSHKNSKTAAPPSQKPKVGLLIMLATIVRSRPGLLQQQAQTIRNKFQDQDQLPTLLWVYGQAAKVDLVVGMYLWIHNLLPVAVLNTSNPLIRHKALLFLESVLLANLEQARVTLLDGVSRNRLRLPAASLALVMQAAFPSDSAKNEATSRFKAVYPLIKELALAGTPKSEAIQKVAQQLLPLVVAVLSQAEDLKVPSQEACSNFSWCLSQNTYCYLQWEKLHLENLDASNSVLDHIRKEWKQVSPRLSPLIKLKDTLQNLRLKHKHALALSQNNPKSKVQLKIADDHCKALLSKLSAFPSCVSATLTLGAAVVMGYGFYLLALNRTPGNGTAGYS